MRLLAYVTTALLTGVLVLSGGSAAHAADPTPNAGLIPLPIGACSDTAGIIGALNPAFGNDCFNA